MTLLAGGPSIFLQKNLLGESDVSMSEEGKSESLPYVSISDKVPLIESHKKSKLSKKCKGLLVFALLLATAGAVVGYYLYWRNVVGLKIMSLNTWGMPASLGSSDKEIRMAAIGW